MLEFSQILNKIIGLFEIGQHATGSLRYKNFEYAVNQARLILCCVGEFIFSLRPVNTKLPDVSYS